jgi:hypothetical protein
MKKHGNFKNVNYKENHSMLLKRTTQSVLINRVNPKLVTNGPQLQAARGLSVDRGRAKLRAEARFHHA